MSQRKEIPNSHNYHEARQERAAVGRKAEVHMAVWLGQFYRTSFRENKLDAGKDKSSQRMRKSQKMRAYC